MRMGRITDFAYEKRLSINVKLCLDVEEASHDVPYFSARSLCRPLCRRRGTKCIDSIHLDIARSDGVMMICSNWFSCGKMGDERCIVNTIKLKENIPIVC